MLGLLLAISIVLDLSTPVMCRRSSAPTHFEQEQYWRIWRETWWIGLLRSFEKVEQKVARERRAPLQD